MSKENSRPDLFTKREILTLGIVLTGGIGCVCVANSISEEHLFWKNFFFSMAALLIADTVVHLLISKVARQETINIFKEQFDRISPEVIKQVINDKLDSNYRNLSEFGIVNAYSPLIIPSRIKDFKDAETDILIFKIWVEGLGSMIPELINALNRGVAVTIIVLDLGEAQMIEKRAGQIDKNAEDIRRSIEDNIAMVRDVYSGQNKEPVKLLAGNRQYLKVYQHNSFVSTSLFKIDRDFYVGLYLHGEYAMDGILFKIRENKEDKCFYNKLSEHCKAQIQTATQIIP